MYTLKIAQSCRDDIKSNVKYIRNNLQNPIAAQRLSDEIKQSYKKIKENPFIYPSVSDKYLASKGYRFSLVKKYMLFLKVTEKEIEIIRCLYGYRDWINILKEKE